MIPKIISTEIRISEDIRIPEGHIEETMVRIFSSEISDKISLEYNEYDDHRISTVTGSVVIMSVEERDTIVNYIRMMEEKISDS